MKKLGLMLGVVVLLGSGLTACTSDNDRNCQNRTECNKSERERCDKKKRCHKKNDRYNKKGDKQFNCFTAEERTSFKAMKSAWANFDQLDEAKQIELIEKAKVFADSTMARKARKQASMKAQWDEFDELSTAEQKVLLETVFVGRFHKKGDDMNRGRIHKGDDMNRGKQKKECLK